MKLFFWLYSVLLYSVSWAQSSETYTVKPGADILDVIPLREIFRYPDFVSGTVVFKDGRSAAGKLNYNILICQVQFIDPKGDTLSLAEEHTVKHIFITDDTFYYSKGYVRLVAGNSPVKLAEKEYFKEYIQKPGSYGLSSSTTATNTISVLVADKSYNLNTNQEVVLVKTKEYFIGNKYNQFTLADKKNLFKMFPKHATAIGNYLNASPVDFNRKEDLIRLLSFLEGL